jgi:hypothetical protein
MALVFVLLAQKRLNECVRWLTGFECGQGLDKQVANPVPEFGRSKPQHQAGDGVSRAGLCQSSWRDDGRPVLAVALYANSTRGKYVRRNYRQNWAGGNLKIPGRSFESSRRSRSHVQRVKKSVLLILGTQ